MTAQPYYLNIIRLKNFHGIHVKTEKAFCKYFMHEFSFGISENPISAPDAEYRDIKSSARIKIIVFLLLLYYINNKRQV